MTLLNKWCEALFLVTRRSCNFSDFPYKWLKVQFYFAILKHFCPILPPEAAQTIEPGKTTLRVFSLFVRVLEKLGNSSTSSLLKTPCRKIHAGRSEASSDGFLDQDSVLLNLEMFRVGTLANMQRKKQAACCEQSGRQLNDSPANKDSMNACRC